MVEPEQGEVGNREVFYGISYAPTRETKCLTPVVFASWQRTQVEVTITVTKRLVE
jgi:hypothetical protein